MLLQNVGTARGVWKGKESEAVRGDKDVEAICAKTRLTWGCVHMLGNKQQINPKVKQSNNL